MDEACALIKTELDSMPTELDELRRKIMQLEIEEAALKKEDDRLSQGTSGDICRRSWPSLREEYLTQKAQWENEKASVEKLSRDP